MPKVAIFGSGLSAGYVYAACLDNGVEADFFTDNRKPEFFGPVKLSWVPKWVKARLYPVWLFSLGEKAAYLSYMGRSSGSTTFPENGRIKTSAYNPTEVLEQLQPLGAKITVGKFSDAEIEQISKQYTYTFVTFPLQQSKTEDKLVPYWIYMLRNQSSLSLPNMVIYNGTQFFPWTRFSHYWDVQMWEYSHLKFLERPSCPAIGAELRRIADIAPGVPEYTSPFPKVAMVGRWARWSKNVLAQDAYAQTDKILKEIK